MKNHFLLKALFGAFLVLKIAQVQPFAGWSWWFVFMPLVLHFAHWYALELWKRLGIAAKLDYELAKLQYDMVLKKEVKKAKKDIENGK